MEWGEIEAILPRLEKRAEQAAWTAIQDETAVADAVAHARAMLWEHRERLVREKVFSWLGAVAYNKAIDEGRHRRRNPRLGSTLGTGGEPRWAAKLAQLPRSTLSMSDRVAFQQARSAVLALLPPKQASALRLYLDGHSGAEIARRLRISEAAVRKRIHDAKESVRAALGGEADGFIPRQKDW